MESGSKRKEGEPLLAASRRIVNPLRGDERHQVNERGAPQRETGFIARLLLAMFGALLAACLGVLWQT